MAQCLQRINGMISMQYCQSMSIIGTGLTIFRVLTIWLWLIAAQVRYSTKSRACYHASSDFTSHNLRTLERLLQSSVKAQELKSLLLGQTEPYNRDLWCHWLFRSFKRQ